MDGTATSKKQADAQLKRLRRERGVDGLVASNSALVYSLNQALNILSDQLYEKPTHFLFELIQNADDNNYSDGKIPMLTFEVWQNADGAYLRTDCNEVGFTIREIDALARLGQSTKTAPVNGQQGYIGEKGIGFKSVFKVANEVNVASGYYEFKFDRSQLIGMILPNPSPFPGRNYAMALTQFLLRLNSHTIYANILNDLSDIKPQLLMFLRKIKTLYVKTPSRRIAYRIDNQSEPAFAGETALISRENETTSSTEITKYIVVRYTVNNMPAEPRRQGVTESQVVLAFPIVDRIEAQEVYAFLPVGNFGFSFLIQADFLLIANREAIQHDCPWNMALHSGIQQAVLAAVRRFNSMPGDPSGQGLCYKWPYYLARWATGADFWNSLHRGIFDRLHNERIVISRDPTALLQIPSSVFHIPHKFRFNGGSLFDIQPLRQKHLAFNYDDNQGNLPEVLQSLGVKEMTIQHLCAEFEQWISAVGGAGIGAQQTTWYQQVARLFRRSLELKSRLKSLPIVPLQNGSWVSANTSHLYLASKNQDEHVPNGIQIVLVDSTASNDPVRRAFFEFLDIKPYNPEQICHLILGLHSHIPEGRPSDDWVRDIAYLFGHSDLLSNIHYAAIRFICENNNLLYHGSSLYFVDPNTTPGLIDKYKFVSESPFLLVHSRYEREICGEDTTKVTKFRAWLRDCCSMSAIPVLVRHSRLTREWEFLRDTDVEELLLLLRKHWQKYRRHPEITEPIRGLQVQCTDGNARPLHQTALQDLELLWACPHLNFLSLQNPEKWSFLAQFGVLTTLNNTATLQELTALSRLAPEAVDRTQIHKFYKALSVSCHNIGTSEIRNAFSCEPLVFIARPGPKWVRHDSCVWTASPALRNVTRLDTRFSDCRALFHDCLGVPAASIRHVVDEICLLRDATEENHCWELLKLLSSFFADGATLSASELQRLKATRIFPISRVGADSSVQNAGTTTDLRAVNDTSWYIPDNTILSAAFETRVDLLAFKVAKVQSILDIFGKLGCEEKLLSRAVRETVQQRGERIRDLLKEGQINRRVAVIKCLAARENACLIANSTTFRVWSVPSVLITRRLSSIVVVEDTECVAFEEGQHRTDIFFREEMTNIQQSLANHLLAQYFSRLFEITKPNDVNVANLILSVPDEGLSGVVERENLFPSEGTAERGDGGNNADKQAYATADSGTGELTHPSPPAHSPTSLRGLMPSLETRVRDIAELAGQFSISSSSISIPPEPKQIARRSQRLRATRAAEIPPPYRAPSAFSYQNNGGTDRAATAVDCNNVRGRVASPLPLSRSPRRDVRDLTAYDIRMKQVGFLGEVFIHRLFARRIENWSFHNWTSRLRVEDGHPPFEKAEGQFTDFTYQDCDEKMKELLRETGLKPRAEWSSTTTYKIEVKTTALACGEPFYVSQNQVDMMKNCADDPNNVYLLIRVYNVETDNLDVKFYLNPWKLYLDGVLDFRSEGGYTVRAPA